MTTPARARIELFGLFIFIATLAAQAQIQTISATIDAN